MDEIVKRALAKWPDVPDCYGWLSLDGRGRWRLGPERQTISHGPMIEFINRNYVRDARGRWFFQNGPQRVFAELECAPHVWRLIPDGSGALELRDHTGATAAHASSAWLTDTGRFVIEADGRIGALHDHDSDVLIAHLCDAQGQLLGEAVAVERLGHWLDDAALARREALFVLLPGALAPLPLQAIASTELGQRFGFDPHPHAD